MINETGLILIMSLAIVFMCLFFICGEGGKHKLMLLFALSGVYLLGMLAAYSALLVGGICVFLWCVITAFLGV